MEPQALWQVSSPGVTVYHGASDTEVMAPVTGTTAGGLRIVAGLGARIITFPLPSQTSKPLEGLGGRDYVVADWREPAWALFTEVRVSGRVFRQEEALRTPVLRERGGYYCCEARELGIMSFGKSREAALDSFREDFSVLWDVIARSADESLTRDAIAVKRALHRIVDTVDAE
jgi:hypothetical protein